MLFKQAFKDGIRKGAVTMTFRVWESVKAAAGHSYPLGPSDAIVVTTIDAVSIGSITAAQARRAGFGGVDELVATLRASTETRLTSRSRVYRVAFRHEDQADPRIARREDTSAAALDEVAARLERIDRLSGRDPWTLDALRTIAEHPHVAASKLAPQKGREVRAFNADIRKLKELGLTVSHETGYSLSPLGRALLLRRSKRT